MFRAVFADDEPWALAGIMTVIDWEAYGLKPVAGYTDAEEAVAHLTADLPDVIFTDIRMPGLSGLEMISRCKELGCPAVFVVVSAYAEFAYAQKAIEGGAFAYILKPLVPEDMAQTANKLRAHLEGLRQGRLRRVMNECVLTALQHGDSGRMDPFLSQMIDDLGEYRIGILDTSSAKERLPDALAERSFHVLADKTLCFMRASESCACFDAASGISSGTDALPRLIREAFIASHTKAFYRLEGCIPYKVGGGARAFPLTNLFRSLREKSVSRGKAELMRLEQLARSETLMIDSLTLLYNNLLRELYAIKPEQAVQETLHAFADCFALYSVFRTVENMFESLCILLESVCAQDADVDMPDLVKRMACYIDDNFAQPLTLEQLSQRFHTSLFHLSRMFKQGTGMTYTAYLTAKRIDYACELLQQTRLSVAEVGRRSGYADYFYFSKVFKKCKGVPPTNYRKGDAEDAE